MTCANCSRDALYTYAVSESYLLHYCQYHLPRFLTSQKNAGLLALQVPAPVVEEPVAVEAEVVKPSKSKKSTPAVEEPAVEETPTEDAPTEE
jgi:hypothetical protein